MYDKDYFLPVTRLDDIIMINSLEDIYKLEEQFQTNIYKFNHFLNIINKLFESREKTHFALKIGTAYNRSLLFKDTSFNSAKKIS